MSPAYPKTLNPKPSVDESQIVWLEVRSVWDILLEGTTKLSNNPFRLDGMHMLCW